MPDIGKRRNDEEGKWITDPDDILKKRTNDQEKNRCCCHSSDSFKIFVVPIKIQLSYLLLALLLR